MDNFNKNKQDTGSNEQAKNIKGELTYEDKVIQKIVGYSLGKIDGLLNIEGGFFSNITDKLVNVDNPTAGVDVEVGKKQVAVDLSIVVEYEKNAVKIYDEIKHVVSEQINKMTELDVVEVNVDVVDIKTREQFEEDSVSLQDRVSDAASSTGKAISNQTEKSKRDLKKAAPQRKEGDKPRVQ
ncbi:Asp23/Gls24 family envelope stress response protein [Liquorilactobacillus oeni]|uniref:Stress response regulator gls24 homolog n=1 Tax=Liquorilactobacillus oeni DSM 19972 TaxID=1423777 RepID=A0A0R1M9Z6_9LACO|nr:Asp23/Gls24 family envelope stress response protein [Liquorilactobacillus oeni]KRL05165.1 hypothetical protein FD46_GL001116 [Liquorilactobacillus oeni DSM 19972]